MPILTVYPDPNPETTSVDGFGRRDPQNESFSTLRNSAGNSSDDSQTANDTVRLVTASGSPNFRDMVRGIYLFDTSALTSSATISAATFSLFGTAKENGLYSIGLTLVSSSPTSNTAIVNADYNIANFGTTEFATRIAYADFSIVGYNDMALNASGISNISLTGISKFGTRGDADFDNSAPAHPGSIKVASLTANFADQAGTSNDPKLTITYSSGVSNDVLVFLTT